MWDEFYARVDALLERALQSELPTRRPAVQHGDGNRDANQPTDSSALSSTIVPPSFDINSQDPPGPAAPEAQADTEAHSADSGSVSVPQLGESHVVHHEPVLPAASNAGSLQPETLIPQVNSERQTSPTGITLDDSIDNTIHPPPVVPAQKFPPQAQAALSDTDTPESHALHLTSPSDKDNMDEATVHTASVVRFAKEDAVKIIPNNESSAASKHLVDSALSDDDRTSSKSSDSDSESHSAESEEFTDVHGTQSSSNRTRRGLLPPPSAVSYNRSKKGKPKTRKIPDMKPQATPATTHEMKKLVLGG